MIHISLCPTAIRGLLFLATGLATLPAFGQDGALATLTTPVGVSADTSVGEFTGDGQADIAFLSDGSLVVFHGPTTYDYPVVSLQQPEGQTSLTVVGKLSGGLGDRIITADAQGLQEWTLQAGGAGIVPTPIAGTGLAASARSLSAEDLNGDGLEDLVAIGPGGMLVTIWTQDAVGGFRLSASFGSTEGVVGCFGGEWDLSTAGRELLVVRESQLAVLDSGTLQEIVSYPLIGEAREAVVLREQFGLGTAVAILEARTGGTKWLSIWRPNGLSESGLDLGAMGFFGLGAGDADADGNDDPVMAFTSTPAMVVFFNLVGFFGVVEGPSLDVGIYAATMYAPYGPTYSEQDSGVVSGDMDGDGDLDFMFVCDATSKLKVALNGGIISEESYRPIFNSVQLESLGSEPRVVVTGEMPENFPLTKSSVDFELRAPNDTAATFRGTLADLGPGDSFVVSLPLGVPSVEAEALDVAGGLFVAGFAVVRQDGITLATYPSNVEKVEIYAFEPGILPPGPPPPLPIIPPPTDGPRPTPPPAPTPTPLPE